MPSLELTSDESSIAVLSAAMFGFSTDRAAWFRRQRDIKGEILRSVPSDPRAKSDAPVGWWTGWLNIGPVAREEAVGMADAIDRAIVWYQAHPGALPDWFDPFPTWDRPGIERVLERPKTLGSLVRTADFMRQGAFESRVRPEPYAVILTRNDLEPPSATPPIEPEGEEQAPPLGRRAS